MARFFWFKSECANDRQSIQGTNKDRTDNIAYYILALQTGTNIENNARNSSPKNNTYKQAYISFHAAPPIQYDFTLL